MAESSFSELIEPAHENRLVVRRTFLEVVDYSQEAQTLFSLGRRRVCSDGALFDIGKQAHRFDAQPLHTDAAHTKSQPSRRSQREVNFEIHGLSDTESEPEMEAPLCREQRQEATPATGADTTGRLTAGDGSDAILQAKEPGAFRLSLADKLKPGGSVVLGSPLPRGQSTWSDATRSPSLYSPSTCSSVSEQDSRIQKLREESNRLAMENRYLQEYVRELSKQTGASCHADPVAKPSPSALTFPGASTGKQALAVQPQLSQQPQGAPTEGLPTSAGGGTADVPKDSTPASSGQTTVMLRNLPNNYSRAMVLAMLDDAGWREKINFLYLPIDFNSRACLGYCFVNIEDSADVPAFWQTFDGFSNWILPSRKVCKMSWGGPDQGYAAHVARYRNSPVMHKSVPDEYKPVVFEKGVRVVFPGPSKAPRAPRVRHRNDARAPRWSPPCLRAADTGAGRAPHGAAS